MNKYNLEGFYLYSGAPNGRGRLSGEIEIGDSGAFEAEITDHASRVPLQSIKGHIKSGEGLTKLQFLKFPPATNLANLVYSLHKKDDKEIEGKYEGRWGALPFKVKYQIDYNLFIAQIDMAMCSVGDKTEIILNKK